MADQNISQILAALAAQRSNSTPQQGAAPLLNLGQQQYPLGYPSGPPAGNPGFVLPQPSNSGSLDISSIKPINSGSVSIADAIAKARNIAAEKGVAYDPRSQSRDLDPRGGRSYRRSRSPSRSPPRGIRDSYRDSYNPYRDERRDERRASDRGFARERSLSPNRNGRGPPAYGSPSARPYGERSPPGRRPAMEDDNSEVITIEPSLVGLIIGRQGENLRRIETQTQTRVQFLSAQEAPGALRQCKITGNRASRAEAKTEIYKTIDENAGGRGSAPPPRGGAPKGGAPPSMRDAEATEQIMVPDKTVGLIIGRGGETIRDLQERSGCHVNIVGENKSVNGLRPVNLIGTLQAAQVAKNLILEIVESDTAGSRPEPGRERNTYANEAPSNDRINDKIYVPGEAVGMIIGKGGETIKEMQNSTGCKINVQQASGRGDDQREIGLVGTRSAIEQAKVAIREKVDAVEQKNRPGAPRHDNGYDSYSQSQQQQHQQQQSYPQQGGSQQSQQAGPGQASSGGDSADPYAAYGGYQAYVAMWYAAMAQQNQQPPNGQGQSDQPGGAPGS